MKAKEVLRRYAAGERNFQGVNLRGQSFQGQDLSRADFSGADLRGTNFKLANLQGVNFTRAEAGLQKRWVAFLLFISLLLSGILGACSLWFAFVTLLLFDNSAYENFYIESFSIIFIVIFLIITFRKGLIAVAVAGAVIFAGAVAITVATALVFASAEVGAVAVAFAFTVTGVIAGTVAVVVAVALAFATSNTIFVAVAVAVAGSGTVAVAGSGAVAGASAEVLAVAGALIFALFGFYIGWRALKGDERDAWVRPFAITLAATGGSSFHGANLTGASFTGATLKNSDFRKAILTGTCFLRAKKLDLARPGESYLESLKVQKWLIGSGKDINFDHFDLHGVNFQGKNLTDASFIGADLSEANLQDADLSRAILVKTQLDNTDFTGATLTGAYIEDWNITDSTKFRGVRCEYIHMRLPTKENPNPRRKPDNEKEVFADGDFEDFIKPIVDTLDLYHNQGVDPRAIAISFKELAENNPDAEPEIVAMEKRGEDKFLLRVKTTPQADKSQLSASYFEAYNQLKILSEVNIKLLVEKDSRIKQLENFVMTALKSPRFHIEGDTSLSGDRNIDINQGNYNEEIEGDNIEGNQTNLQE